MCLCVLEFCIECSLNLSQMSPGEKKERETLSYQVKSHGRLAERSLYHPAAAHEWLESKHSWLNMHCPHVHKEYIFCITSTQNYGVIINYICNTGRAIVCKYTKVPDSNKHTICMKYFVFNNGNFSKSNISVLEVFLCTSK